MNPLRNSVSQLVGGYRITQIIGAACRLDLFDQIDNGSMSLEKLSRVLKAKPFLLIRVLDVLVNLDLLSLKNRKYTVTPMGKFLCRDHPSSIKHFAIMSSSSWYWNPWARLHEVLVTGKSGFIIEHKEAAFEYMKSHKSAADDFHRAMGTNVNPIPSVLERSIRMSSVKTILDLGGGDGSLALSVAGYFSQVRVTVGDLSHAEKRAKGKIRKSPSKNRVDFKVMDFFKPILKKYDLIILRHILHDWSDDKAKIILRRCKAALNASGVIIVMERTKSGDSSRQTLLANVEMIVAMELGVERTKLEFKKIFKDVGLKATTEYHDSIVRDVFLLRK